MTALLRSEGGQLGWHGGETGEVEDALCAGAQSGGSRTFRRPSGGISFSFLLKLATPLSP